MTNRFFRNAVGVAALTSLALGLACSGSSDPDPVAPPATVNKPGTPIVSISGLTASNNAITKHQYLISASDPSGLATSFSISGTPAGSTFKEISKGMWTYIPATAGNEIITVKATNSGGTSDGGGVMASVVNNQEPSGYSKTATVPVGGERNVTLPHNDGDGDLVTWVVGAAPTGLTAAINGSSLLITADKDAEAKEYKLPLTYTEKHPTVGYVVDTKTFDFIVAVSVGGSTGGGDDVFDWHQGDTRGQVHAFPTNGLEKAAYGVPYTFQFNAGDPFVPTNVIVDWHVNGGLSPFNAEGENAPPPESWIGQPQVDGQYRRPDIDKLGPSFERWRMGTDFQKGVSNNRVENFPSGRMYFVAQDTDDNEYFPDSYSSRTLFGVRADFANDNVLAYQSFYINVTDNSGVGIGVTGTGNTVANAFTAAGNGGRITNYVLNKRAGIDPRKDENVPLTVPWGGKGGTVVKNMGVSYSSENMLVFRHPNDDYSYDLSASINLSHLLFMDTDISDYGDVITFMLEGVTVGDWRMGLSGSLSGGTNRPWVSGWVPGVAASSYGTALKGSDYDVTAAIRPFLSRPYPINGTDLTLANSRAADALRNFSGTVYLEGVDEGHYENGLPQNVYRYHGASDSTVYLDDDKDFNARGNLKGMAGGYYPTGVYPSPIQFVTVPKLADLKKNVNGADGLTFHYRAIDLGGNTRVFEVFVPTRDNSAPQIDGFCWDENEIGTSISNGAADPRDVTHGDLVGQRAFTSPSRPDVWASLQPSEGQTTSWRFQWNEVPNTGSAVTGGVTPAPYFIADNPVEVSGTGATTTVLQSVSDPIYLMVPDGKQVDPYGGPTNPVAAFKPDTLHGLPTAFEVSWKPSRWQGRREYQFEIYGWDKYGAGMRPFPMSGSVWGTVQGEPIYKKFYNNGEVVQVGPADLTIKGFAMVNVNPFFDLSFPIENRIYNQYGFDTSESWLSTPTVGKSAPWEVMVIPPDTPLLISAARTTASSADAIQFPVIGPAVVSANWAKVGGRFTTFENGTGNPLGALEAAKLPAISWETGNLISYAYIEPDKAQDDAALTNPDDRLKIDLTANVGSGQLALWTDPSIGAKDAAGALLYDTELDVPKPWGVQDTRIAGTSKGAFDYHGYMYGIGSYGMMKDGVIQVAMPSVGQSAFFHVDRTVAAANKFPSTYYEERVGWFNKPMVVEIEPNPSANMGGSFLPIVLPIFPAAASNMTDKQYAKYIDWSEQRTKEDTLSGTKIASPNAGYDDLAVTTPTYASGLPYTFYIGGDGNPSYALVSLKKSDKSAGYYTSTTATSTSGSVTAPVWVVERTGKPTWDNNGSVVQFDNDIYWNDYDPLSDDPEDKFEADYLADKDYTHLVHHSNWGDLADQTFGTFVANIDRGSFSGVTGTNTLDAGSTSSNSNLGARLYSLVSKLPGNTTTITSTNTADRNYRSNVVDTLQVLSYVSGTELGPDNHQALPVFLEFGNLNRLPAITNLDTSFRGRYLIGDSSGFPIYRPTYWQGYKEGEPLPADGKNVPVVSYIARYTDPYTGLAGTMGLITDNLSGTIYGVPSGFGPITNLRITSDPFASSPTLALAAKAPAEYTKTNNLRTSPGVSNYLTGVATVTLAAATTPVAGETYTPYQSTTPITIPAGAAIMLTTDGTTTRTWTYNRAPSEVVAKAYNDGGPKNGAGTEYPAHYKVWLTWDNPSASSTGLKELRPNISGNIIEFFDAADLTNSALAPSAVPLYKVYVGPNVNAFPIPDAWLPFLGYQGAGTFFAEIPDTRRVVVRVRTVRYGDKTKELGTPGSFVNFNRAPFKQALPAVWFDTLSTKIDFTKVGSDVMTNVASESVYHGLRKEWVFGPSGALVSPDAIDVSTITTGDYNATVTRMPAGIGGANGATIVNAGPGGSTWDATLSSTTSKLNIEPGAPIITYTSAAATPPTAANIALGTVTAGPGANQVTFDATAAWKANFVLTGTTGPDDILTVVYPFTVTVDYMGETGTSPARRSAPKTFNLTYTNDYGLVTYAGFKPNQTISSVLDVDRTVYKSDADWTSLSNNTVVTITPPLPALNAFSWPGNFTAGGSMVTTGAAAHGPTNNTDVIITVGTPTIDTGSDTGGEAPSSLPALGLDYDPASGAITFKATKALKDAFKLVDDDSDGTETLTADYPVTLQLKYFGNSTTSAGRLSETKTFHIVLARDYDDVDWGGFKKDAEVTFGAIPAGGFAAAKADNGTGTITFDTVDPNTITFERASSAITGKHDKMAWSVVSIGNGHMDLSTYVDTDPSGVGHDAVIPSELIATPDAALNAILSTWTGTFTKTSPGNGPIALTIAAGDLATFFPTDSTGDGATAKIEAGDTCDVTFEVTLRASFTGISGSQSPARTTEVTIPVKLTVTKS